MTMFLNLLSLVEEADEEKVLGVKRSAFISSKMVSLILGSVVISTGNEKSFVIGIFK